MKIHNGSVMSLTWVHYELIIIGVLAPVIFFYLFLMKQYYAGKKNSIIGHLTFTLTLLWIGFILKVMPAAWNPLKWKSYVFPPLEIIIDIVVAGYLVGILWNLWLGEKDVELT